GGRETRKASKGANDRGCALDRQTASRVADLTRRGEGARDVEAVRGDRHATGALRRELDADIRVRSESAHLHGQPGRGAEHLDLVVAGRGRPELSRAFRREVAGGRGHGELCRADREVSVRVEG